MTTPQASIAVLQTLLNQAGFSATAPRFDALWHAFQRFLLVQVACDDSDVLCQWGTYTPSPEAFEFDLTRQFSFAGEGEGPSMQQLHCTLSFPRTIALGVEAGCSWASDFPTTTAFCLDLESLEAFEAVRVANHATAFSLTLEDL